LSDPVSKLIVVRCLAGNLRKKLLRNIELLQKFIRRILTKTLAFDKENTLFTALSGLLPEGAEAFDSLVGSRNNSFHKFRSAHRLCLHAPAPHGA
jgi:hypothetical protein